jgi:hypothetical protein
LYLAPGTVQHYLYLAYKKLGINRRQRLPHLFFNKDNWYQLTGIFYQNLK